jgi:hypothetical protein
MKVEQRWGEILVLWLQTYTTYREGLLIIAIATIINNLINTVLYGFI